MIAPNLLAREFGAEAPNRRWVGDTTELLARSGKLYPAAILDPYSRIIVGWAVSAVNDRHLTGRALEQALRRRAPESGPLHHSDQGSTYASQHYREALAARGITCSMSRRGECYDNAVMESWFSTLELELGERFESHGQAKDALFDYVEVFYNQKRRNSTVAIPARRVRKALRWHPSGAGVGIGRLSTESGQAQPEAWDDYVP